MTISENLLQQIKNDNHARELSIQVLKHIIDKLNTECRDIKADLFDLMSNPDSENAVEFGKINLLEKQSIKDEVQNLLFSLTSNSINICNNDLKSDDKFDLPGDSLTAEKISNIANGDIVTLIESNDLKSNINITTNEFNSETKLLTDSSDSGKYLEENNTDHDSVNNQNSDMQDLHHTDSHTEFATPSTNLEPDLISELSEIIEENAEYNEENETETKDSSEDLTCSEKLNDENNKLIQESNIINESVDLNYDPNVEISVEENYLVNKKVKNNQGRTGTIVGYNDFGITKEMRVIWDGSGDSSRFPISENNPMQLFEQGTLEFVDEEDRRTYLNDPNHNTEIVEQSTDAVDYNLNNLHNLLMVDWTVKENTDAIKEKAQIDIDQNKSTSFHIFASLVKYAMDRYTRDEKDRRFFAGYRSFIERDITDKRLYEIIKDSINEFRPLPSFNYLNNGGGLNLYAEICKAYAFCYKGGLKDLFSEVLKIHKLLAYNISDEGIVKQTLLEIKKQIERGLNEGVRGNNDVIRIELNDNGFNLPLRKSTAQFWSCADIEELYTVFLPFLQLIDNWYYQDDVNSIRDYYKNWLLDSFNAWREDIENHNVHEGRLYEPHYRNNRPYFTVNPDNLNDVSIIIPEYTNVSQFDNGWEYRIECTDESDIIQGDLIIQEAVGAEWTTSSQRCSVLFSNLFKPITVLIVQKIAEDEYATIKEWHLINDFLIFDQAGYEVHKIRPNVQYRVIVKEESTFEASGTTIDYDYTNNGIRFTNITTTETSILKFDNAIISTGTSSLILQDSSEEITRFEVYTQDNEKVVCYQSHPTIYIDVDNNRIPFLRINGEAQRIQDCEIVEGNNNKFIIIPIIQVLNDNPEGIFTVEYGVEGGRNKSLSYAVVKPNSFSVIKFGSFRDDGNYIGRRITNSNGYLDIISRFSLRTNNDEDNSYSIRLSAKTQSVDNRTYFRYFVSILNSNCEKITVGIPELNLVIKIPVYKATYNYFNGDDNFISREISLSSIADGIFIKIDGANRIWINDGAAQRFAIDQTGFIDLTNVSGSSICTRNEPRCYHFGEDNGLDRRIYCIQDYNIFKVNYSDMYNSACNYGIKIQDYINDNDIKISNNKIRYKVQNLDVNSCVKVKLFEKGTDQIQSENYNRQNGSYELDNIDDNRAYLVKCFLCVGNREYLIKEITIRSLFLN